MYNIWERKYSAKCVKWGDSFYLFGNCRVGQLNSKSFGASGLELGKSFYYPNMLVL